MLYKAITTLCAACAIAAPALATDLVATEGRDTVRLAEAACTNTTVLNQVEHDMRRYLRAASAELQGRNYVACWRPTAVGAHLIYEDGDQGLVPLSNLRTLLRV